MTARPQSPAAAALSLVQAMIANRQDKMDIELGPVVQAGVQIHGKWRVTAEKVED